MKTIFKFLLPVLLLASCAKDKYQPKGDYQPAGTYSSVSSMTIVVDSTDYTDVWTNGSDFDFIAHISCPLITQKVIDEGAVMAYMLDVDAAGNSINYALPFSMSQNSTWSDYSLHLNFYSTIHFFHFRMHGYDTKNPTYPSSYDAITLKIVTISNAREIPKHLNINDYSAVKDFFHLHE